MYRQIIILLFVGFIARYFQKSSKDNDLSIYDDADWWNPNSSFSLLHRMNGVRIPFFVTNLPLNGSIVDVGCGGGLVTEPVGLSGRFHSVLGLDINNKALDKARKHILDNSIVSYKTASIYNIPLSNSSVDGVIVSDVFEHLEDLPRALVEVFRILRPGGVVVFDTIARSWWSWLSTYFAAQEVLGIIEPGAHDWNLFINPQELESVLISIGFIANASEWIGIAPKLSIVNALKKRSKYHLIESFFEDPHDLRSSYMGVAVKAP